MGKFTKYLTVFGMASFVGVLWLASARGYGLDNLSDPTSLRESNKVCPDHQKDQYGNCPPRTHRRSLGSRAYYGGGGK